MSVSDSILVSIDTEFQLIDLRKQGILSKGFQFNELEDMRYCAPYLRHMPLSSILRDCARIQIGLLEAGFLSRGALTVGPLRQLRGIVIGHAYNEAVCLEKSSNHPAITIGSAVVRDYLGSWKQLLVERERIREQLKASSRWLDISAQDVWTAAAESEKWVREIQSCVDCIDVIEGQHIFNYVQFGIRENLWSNRAQTITNATREKSKWHLGIWDHVKRTKKRRIHDRWSWVCQELAK